MRLLGSTMATVRKLWAAPHTASACSSVNRFHVSATEPETLLHEVRDKESGNVRRIAYTKLPGPRTVGLFYVPGFMAHKGGGMPVALHSFSQKYGFPYIRYDPSGMGESQGVKITETKFSLWLEDAKEMFLNVAEGPQIVICSSMGCWITCHLARMHPEKFAAILMLAPAINFHNRFEKMLRSQLTPTLVKKLDEGGVVTLYVPEYGDFPITMEHFTGMKKFALTMEPNKLPLSLPVRIIHGVKDKDSPHTESLPLMYSIGTDDVHLTYLKHASHSLTDDLSLESIYDAILKLASEVDRKAKL